MSDVEERILNYFDTVNERVNALGKSNDDLRFEITELKAEVNELQKRSPELFLTSHTAYTRFNDGKMFDWHFCSKVKFGDGTDLSEKYWNAQVFCESVRILVEPVESNTHHHFELDFIAGQPGVPVTLRNFVKDVEKRFCEPMEYPGGQTAFRDLLCSNENRPCCYSGMKKDIDEYTQDCRFQLLYGEG